MKQKKRKPECGTCVQRKACKMYGEEPGSKNCLDMLKKARNLDYVKVRTCNSVVKSATLTK